MIPLITIVITFIFIYLLIGLHEKRLIVKKDRKLKLYKLALLSLAINPHDLKKREVVFNTGEAYLKFKLPYKKNFHLRKKIILSDIKKLVHKQEFKLKAA